MRIQTLKYNVYNTFICFVLVTLANLILHPITCKKKLFSLKKLTITSKTNKTLYERQSKKKMEMHIKP